MNPYVVVQLVMEGCDLDADVFKSSTKPFPGGGTTFEFLKQTVAHVGLPLSDNAAATAACLYIEVRDEPEVSITGHGTLIGAGMVRLDALVKPLVDEVLSTTGALVNLQLCTPTELSDPSKPPSGGQLRMYLHIEITSRKDAKATSATKEVS